MLGGNTPRIRVGLSLTLVVVGGGLLLCSPLAFNGLSSGHLPGVLSG